MSKCRATTLLIAGALGLSGCVEQVNPTSPSLEHAVFTALGGIEVGESMTLRGAQAELVFLAAGQLPGEFLVVPFHASSQRGARLNVQLTAEQVGSFPVAAELAGGHAAERGGLSLGAAHLPDPALHESLHRRMQRSVEPLIPAFQEMQRREGPGARFAVTPRVPQVGELMEINANALGAACSARDMRTGRVEAVTRRAIIVGDTGNPAGGFTPADYQEFGTAFDDVIDPVVRQHFGDPTDLDGNGRVIVFFTRAVNELTPPGGSGYVAGFFWARDLFDSASCPASNAGEIFFIHAPDPHGEASHIRHTREQVLRSAKGTIGHEYQHLINAGRRLHFNNALVWEETWLDEGLSHMAEELLFYAASGLQPGNNITMELLRSTPAVLEAANSYQVSNLLRYYLFLERADRHAPMGSDLLETRGAAWSFLRYVADHTSRSDVSLFEALANSRVSGLENLNEVLGSGSLEWLRRWGISVYADDLPALAGRGDPLLRQPSWNFRDVMLHVGELLDRPASAGFPLPVRRLEPGHANVFDLPAGGSAIALARGDGSGRPGRLLTTSGGGIPPSSFAVTVVRIE